MITAGPLRPPLIHIAGWPDLNHNVGRGSAENQPGCETQSDQSL
jgi:hypothetical protein